jgi:hypothetical protein
MLSLAGLPTPCKVKGLTVAGVHQWHEPSTVGASMHPRNAESLGDSFSKAIIALLFSN